MPDLPYEPRAQDVARHLREAIHDGRLRAGEPVRQEAVARELGVSRIPVREALRELEAEGLVVTRPHSGARVAKLDFAECDQVYKLRERLEPLAFSESVAGIDDDQVAEAVRRLELLEGLRGEPRRWLEADRDLHLAMYAGLESQRLLRMIVGFWNSTQQYRRVLLTTFTDEDFTVQASEHRLMIDALADRNARAGEALVATHIARSRGRLTAHREMFD